MKRPLFKITDSVTGETMEIRSVSPNRVLMRFLKANPIENFEAGSWNYDIEIERLDTRKDRVG